MSRAIDLKDLKPETRKRLGLTRAGKDRFRKDDVRSHALLTLEPIAYLTRDQRRRVLEHAMKINDV